MNEQEAYWAGQAGTDYHARNPRTARALANAEMFFCRILKRIEGWPSPPIESVLELGAGTGINLRALRRILPESLLTGVEINPDAATELRDVADVTHEVSVTSLSLHTRSPQDQHDLALTKGLLIHIPPDALPAAYDSLYYNTRRYILIAEYFNPTPVEVEYRGQAERLWKRDFGAELLDAYPDLRLLDYGFVYHRDPFPQDNLTWWLMEKRQG